MTRTWAGRRTVAGLLAAIALAACGDGDRGGEDAGTAPAATPAATPDVPARLKTSFAPFRSPAEAIPVSVREALGQPNDDIDWRLAQVLPRTDGATFWAVPGRTLICLVREDADGTSGASCTPISRALEHGVALTNLAAAPGKAATPNRTIVGLAPDGMRRVRIGTPGFPSVTARVSDDNMFTVRDATTEPPETFTLLR
jgi:hypothetical protein